MPTVIDLAVIVTLGTAVAVAILAGAYREHAFARIVVVALLAGTAAYLIRASYWIGGAAWYSSTPSILMGLGVLSGVGALLAYQVWFWRQP